MIGQKSREWEMKHRTHYSLWWHLVYRRIPSDIFGLKSLCVVCHYSVAKSAIEMISSFFNGVCITHSCPSINMCSTTIRTRLCLFHFAFFLSGQHLLMHVDFYIQSHPFLSLMHFYKCVCIVVFHATTHTHTHAWTYIDIQPTYHNNNRKFAF